MKKLKLLFLFIVVISFACTQQEKKKTEQGFVNVKDGQFVINGEPYYFVGTNYWYGPLLAAPERGDRERLKAELDFLAEKGVNNLRVLIGAQGPDSMAYRVSPALQETADEYDKDLLKGLDYLMAELAKRDMYAVLYFANNWIWSGGMAQYLNWNGYGEIPNPFLEEYSWPEYMSYVAQFHSCEPCKEDLRQHIRFIMKRTNSVTGKKYINDPAIMSWQVSNEPRVLQADNKKHFKNWLHNTVDLIDSLAPNQLISTGSEGRVAALESIELYKELHRYPKIDYLTMHIWPYNWGWHQKENEAKTVDSSIIKAKKYFNQHLEVARNLEKPIVLSEFGFPRNGFTTDPEAPVTYRNKFYKEIFQMIAQNSKEEGIFAGLNFWAFGGTAEVDPENPMWEFGDDYTGDPPQEPQGFNAVFMSDTSTFRIIEKYNDKIQ